jgi:hypothetical protein
MVARLHHEAKEVREAKAEAKKRIGELGKHLFSPEKFQARKRKADEDQSPPQPSGQSPLRKGKGKMREKKERARAELASQRRLEDCRGKWGVISKPVEKR